MIIKRRSDIDVVKENAYRREQKKIPGRPPKGISERTIKMALRRSGGFICETAKMLNVTPAAISLRVKGSPYLQDTLKSIIEKNVKLCVTVLLRRVKKQDLQAIRHYLVMKGGEFGYDLREKLQVDASVKGTYGVLLIPGKMSCDEWLLAAREQQ